MLRRARLALFLWNLPGPASSARPRADHGGEQSARHAGGFIIEAIVRVEQLTKKYGERLALHALDLEIAPGSCCGLLGPNGSGKSTLFRILATLTKPTDGRVAVCEHDVVREPMRVREKIGVVFQAPSLDGKLRVLENLRHAGQMYGLRGADLQARIERAVEALDLGERLKDLVETLSGGLKRRVEIAKALLSRPPLLLLDEPSTGLDPGARADMWEHLDAIRKADGTTLLFTTHLMDEAERAERLVLLDEGRIVAEGDPASLRSSISGQVVTIQASDREAIVRQLETEFAQPAAVVGGVVRFESDRAFQVAESFAQQATGKVTSITIGAPTLEDVFVARTGRSFDPVEEGAA